MPFFSSNYSLNSSSETINCCTQLLLRYFGPRFNQRHFQRLHSRVWWATGISFQHGPNTEVHWVVIGRWRRPQFLAPKQQEIVLHQAWVSLEAWEGVPSCWMVKSSFLKCSSISRKAGAKRSSMYTFMLTLTPCFTKVRVYFRVLDAAAQTIKDTGFWRW